MVLDFDEDVDESADHWDPPEEEEVVVQESNWGGFPKACPYEEHAFCEDECEEAKKKLLQEAGEGEGFSCFSYGKCCYCGDKLENPPPPFEEWSEEEK